MEKKNVEAEVEKLNQIYEKVVKLVEISKITGEPLNEFNNKNAQCRNMFKTLETMKAEAEKDEAIESLTNQQLSVLDKWMRFELEFAAKIAG